MGLADRAMQRRHILARDLREFAMLPVDAARMLAAILRRVLLLRRVGHLAEASLPHLPQVVAAFDAAGLDVSGHVELECLAEIHFGAGVPPRLRWILAIGKLAERLVGGLTRLLDCHLVERAEPMPDHFMVNMLDDPEGAPIGVGHPKRQLRNLAVVDHQPLPLRRDEKGFQCGLRELESRRHGMTPWCFGATPWRGIGLTSG